MSGYVIMSFNSFEVIEYIRKNDSGVIGYLSGGKQGDFINYIKENVIFKIPKNLKVLS